jgi:hypothetical protein
MQQGFTSFQVRQAMERLHRALFRRKKRIMDAALLTELSFGPVREQQFKVTAEWEGGEHTVTFNRGNSVVPNRRNLAFRMTYCRFADRIIDEVLRARGVKK